MTAKANNWPKFRIADLAITKSGGTPSTSRTDFWSNGDVPWINSGELKDAPITQPTTHITKLAIENSSAKLFPKDTVVIALTGATTGKVGLLDFECSTNQSVTGIFPSDKVLPKYLFNYLKFSRGQVLELAIGSAQPHINKQIVDDFEIPLPSIDEQKEIVKKLDQILPKIQKVQSRLDKIPALLKRFRQSVLSAACSGRLTADYRRANKIGVWEHATLGTVCLESFYGPRFGRTEYTPDGIPTLRTTDFTEDGHIKLNNPPRISIPAAKRAKFLLKRNDLLVTRTGSIGKMAIFREDYDAIPSAYLIRFRFLGNVSVDYIFYYLMSPIGQSLIGLKSTAVTQPNINAENIKNLDLPTPPIAEQHEIVRRVEALFKFADDIEAKYISARTRIDKLSQSVLSKAFRGELISCEAARSQDSEGLARAENLASKMMAHAIEQFQKRRKIDIHQIALENSIAIVKDGRMSKAHACYEDNSFLIRVKNPQDRFSIAHEMGHIVLHPQQVMQYPVGRKDEMSLLKDKEAEADQFAGEFLMPENFVNTYAQENGLSKTVPITKQAILNKMARFFDVSSFAMQMRLMKLGYKVFV